jgi:magnesium transporter
VIVDCAAYEGGCRVGDVGLDQLREWTERAGAFVWVGLFEPSEEELRTLQGQLGLHDLAIEDAHQAHQRPKLEEYGDGLFLVLRTARRNEEKRRVERGETHVFVGPCYVVSIRHGDTASRAPWRSWRS